jgi:hypothetical protein
MQLNFVRVVVGPLDAVLRGAAQATAEFATSSAQYLLGGPPTLTILLTGMNEATTAHA